MGRYFCFIVKQQKLKQDQRGMMVFFALLLLCMASLLLLPTLLQSGLQSRLLSHAIAHYQLQQIAFQQMKILEKKLKQGEYIHSSPALGAERIVGLSENDWERYDHYKMNNVEIFYIIERLSSAPCMVLMDVNSLPGVQFYRISLRVKDHRDNVVMQQAYIPILLSSIDRKSLGDYSCEMISVMDSQYFSSRDIF